MSAKMWALCTVFIATLAITDLVLLNKLNFHPIVLSRTGYDVSWPNCKATPPPAGSWGIVGVTGGLDFRKNPCLLEESTWFANFGLYMNTGYPGITAKRKFPNKPRPCAATDKICLAYNYGFNAAKYALDYADIEGLHTNMWWLDVETVNSWTVNPYENRASLIGMVDAIQHYAIFPTIGFYSATEQWASITNNWINGLPAWLATGSLEAKSAVMACNSQSFTGGHLQLTQYTAGLDRNFTCYSKYPLKIYSH